MACQVLQAHRDEEPMSEEIGVAYYILILRRGADERGDRCCILYFNQIILA